MCVCANLQILEESISKEDSPEYIFTGYTHRTLAVGQEYDDTALRRQMKMSRYDGKQMLSNKHVESGQIVEHMVWLSTNKQKRLT